ncbi:MAG: radical SAM protein [Clostridia bacterium]|nr:radical SAM protein [Clostridia bacterium]
MRKHTNIALFVPHAGCPHQCAFCDQRAISGKIAPLTPEDVRAAAETALANGGQGGEIAFFGGSFTAIDPTYMIRLLEAAYPYIESGDFSGIRCSTRPDAVDEARLEILKRYGVTAIELGAQSADDRVLRMNGRGHTFVDTLRAASLIRAYGVELGLQMMTGLYGDTGRESVITAEAFCEMRPDTVRIYPTVVLRHTALAALYARGDYAPQTLEDAVALCAELLLMFHRAGIPVIRLGLHAGGDVQRNYVAGPYHPAFRELCESRIYRSVMEAELAKLPQGRYAVYVAPTEISKAVGQKRANLTALAEHGYICKIKARAETPVYTCDIHEMSD